MRIQKNNLAAFIMAFLLVAGFCIVSACKTKEVREEDQLSSLWRAPDIAVRLAKYSPTEISFDKSLLNEEDRKVLDKMVAAARLMDDIFWKQTDPSGFPLMEALQKSKEPWVPEYLHFLKINFGPFDLQDENKPFIGSAQKLPGASFYPPNLTKKEFEDYVAAHPGQKEALESPYTVIERNGSGLIAVPYNVEYKKELEPAAAALREAGEITSNPSLKAYLFQRAEDLLSNVYYKSDCLWIDLKDNLLEIVIGPFEVYEDNLMGLKASYESFVYINDRAEMQKIKGYLDYLEELQKNLPVEPKYRDQRVSGLESPLNVVLQVFNAGSARPGVQTSAFVLPNDEKVREEKGTKKVFLKNVMEAKFQKSLLPISERLLSPEDARRVSFSAYFNEVVLHEICHVLGMNSISLPDGTRISVNKALKERSAAIGEAKADVVGLWSVPLLMERGFIPKEKEAEVYATYLAGMFRAMRFGATEAHGLGTLVQFNYLREKGAFLYDPGTEKYSINQATVRQAVQDLAAEFLTIEGKGSYEKASEFLATYGKIDETTRKTLQKLADIPVDIEPIFPF